MGKTKEEMDKLFEMMKIAHYGVCAYIGLQSFARTSDQTPDMYR